eukprot:CAMPEP_0185763708 /NCGR_PEP_ID=MMETSP1174-20130828/22622_1 /TAXON_ID=35687 /ORGANISM="Dictyocha speculum, Strain CCMP1381" /LENGTH=58 /DNA_ID=CAMNT_0028445925 /DNA_START=441 /DNA_END=617 /DNA_ORIENTATION=-
MSQSEYLSQSRDSTSPSSVAAIAIGEIFDGSRLSQRRTVLSPEQVAKTPGREGDQTAW